MSKGVFREKGTTSARRQAVRPHLAELGKSEVRFELDLTRQVVPVQVCAIAAQVWNSLCLLVRTFPVRECILIPVAIRRHAEVVDGFLQGAEHLIGIGRFEAALPSDLATFEAQCHRA